MTTTWRYRPEWPLWETMTCGHVEVRSFHSLVDPETFEFRTDSVIVRYRTTLDGASNSELGFFFHDTDRSF